jgi:hypothetical protein
MKDLLNILTIVALMLLATWGSILGLERLLGRRELSPPGYTLLGMYVKEFPELGQEAAEALEDGIVTNDEYEKIARQARMLRLQKAIGRTEKP